MDSIRIDNGEKRLSINGDESRIIAFNPSDILFAEKFYKAIAEFESKFAEYQRRLQDLEGEKEEDAGGLPVNMEARIALHRETCEFVREKIDSVFGAGTSQTAFGAALNLDMFSQFFDGITPYFQQARADKVSRYIPKRLEPATGARAKKRKR